MTLIAGQVARAVMLTLERQAKLDTERLAAIGRMLAGVAHDLRNPMTAISGFAQLMAMDVDPEKRKTRCKRILFQIDEMTSMIGDLLAFSRGETKLNPMSVDVEGLARDAREVIDAHCKLRGIVLDVSSTGGRVTVDAGRTKRIIYNLAKNATEALAEGGQLKVDLEEHEGSLILKVSDTGPGIPAEVRDHLFEPFITSGKAYGTGLGLSIVKRFVDDHHGEIDVESQEGLGTSFIVKLPCITKLPV